MKQGWKPKVEEIDFCLACGEDHGKWPDGECASCGAPLKELKKFVKEHDEGTPLNDSPGGES